MNYRIIPYVENNGMRSITDEAMLGIFKKIEDNGLTEAFFYSGEIDTAEKFLSLAKKPTNLVNIVVDDEDNIVFISWLNDFGPNFAFGHFCGFPEIWGKYSVQIGKDIIKYWFSFENDDGPIMDTIMGKVPTVNKKAISFIKKLGMTILGTIPHLAHGPDKSKRVGDVIAYITREN